MIADFWVSLWSSIQLSILRDKGAEDLIRFKTLILRTHQRTHFLDGLDKLHIDRSLPPAVVAAQYHYLSNKIGGLNLQYIEESPKKVWIRYLPPVWSFPDLSLVAVPSSVQRAVFTGWHPFNGVSLGAPQLGFVVTKVVQEGEPYDEGYFFEYDHVLEPDERIQYLPSPVSPDFDPGSAPELDPVEWPAERLIKAKRNFARGYVEDGIRTAVQMYGEHAGSALIAHAARLCALVRFEKLRADLGVHGNTARDLVDIFSAISQLAGESLEALELGPGQFSVTRRNRLFMGQPVHLGAFSALFQYVVMAARMLSARVRVDLVSVGIEDGVVVENWTARDTCERLY
ncbi:hypothetical protein [Pollutimonas bauzanensis]|nr:hypothetical protein [Pollutimonas bauzanensis]